MTVPRPRLPRLPLMSLTEGHVCKRLGTSERRRKDGTSESTQSLQERERLGKGVQYVGGLKGTWNLYNFDLYPKYGPNGEYFRINISDYALQYFEPDHEQLREQDGEPKEDKHGNMFQFLDWSIREEDGDITPFRLPVHRSLSPISVNMRPGGPYGEKWGKTSFKAEITFLRKDCLRLRVPASFVYPDRSGSDFVEFAGIRFTKAAMAERKRRVHGC